jgi:hypothetical protein
VKPGNHAATHDADTEHGRPPFSCPCATMRMPSTDIAAR